LLASGKRARPIVRRLLLFPIFAKGQSGSG
jgi:hypothetical protein